RPASAAASGAGAPGRRAAGCPCWMFGGTTSPGGRSQLLEGEGDGVHAVAVARRGPRRVGEDVAEVGVAAGAAHLGADHAQGAVLVEGDRVVVGGGVEARPAAVGVELRVGAEIGR